MKNISEIEKMHMENHVRTEAIRIASTLQFDNENFEPKLLLTWNENQVKSFIRERLRIIEPEVIKEQFRDRCNVEDYLTFLTELSKQHKRFEMSGYEAKTGECAVSTQEILNSFADLGIYNYTYYLFLDFYKGTPTLYLRFWGENQNLELTYGGYGTVDIIYEIFKLTILTVNDLPTRRRG